MADEKAELAVVADTDLSGVIRRVREQMHYHTADACDLEVICAAAEQLTEARAELEQWKLHHVVRGLEAAVDDLKEESSFRAERIATLEQELEKTQRALLAAHTTLVCVEREADALRAQLAAQAETIAAHEGALVRQAETIAGLRAALRAVRDASPAAAAHCDTVKERTAFDYGYRVACHRLDDAARAALAAGAEETR